MAKDEIRLTEVFSVDPERIYDAWLDSDEHTAFTGSTATVEPRVGGRHTAWDGYITGEILDLEPGRRIVKSWRAEDFPEGEGPSRLEVLLEPDGAGGTRVTLLHTEIPEGQGPRFEEGWQDYYLGTMGEYFSGPGAKKPGKEPAVKAPPVEKAPAKKPAVKKAAKKPAVKKAAKKPAVKKAAKKPVAKKPVKKAAKKPAAKKPVKKAAKKPVAKKPVKKAAKKPAAKKPAAKKPVAKKKPAAKKKTVAKSKLASKKRG